LVVWLEFRRVLCLAVYERITRNEISRRLREKYKKWDISPFTREVKEMRYLAVYEISTRNEIFLFVCSPILQHLINKHVKKIITYMEWSFFAIHDFQKGTVYRRILKFSVFVSLVRPTCRRRRLQSIGSRILTREPRSVTVFTINLIWTVLG
jgi:hypothetical protein